MAELHSIEPHNGAEDVIAALGHALNIAHEENVSSVAIVFVNRDGSARHFWSTLPSTLMMLAAAERLIHKLNLYVDELSPDDGELPGAA